MIICGVPEKYARCRFNNFDGYSDHLKSKVTLLQNWAAQRPTRGLFLCGNVGIGKTHLAVAVVATFLSRRYFDFKFLNVRMFIRQCQSSFSDNQSLSELIEETLDHQLFVLDDLNSEKPTEFAMQCLYDLIDGLYGAEARVIITSNADVEKLHDFAPPIASRIIEMCELVRFDCSDYRIRISEKRANNAGD